MLMMGDLGKVQVWLFAVESSSTIKVFVWGQFLQNFVRIDTRVLPMSEPL